MLTTATAITVIIVAGAYSAFHSVQAVKLYRQLLRERKSSPPIFGGPVKTIHTNETIETVFSIASIESIEPEETPSTESSTPDIGSAVAQTPLFQSFHGSLNDSGQLSRTLVPEELPTPEEDMIFGSATPVIAQLLPETETRKETQRHNLVGAGYHSRAAWLNLNPLRFVLAFAALVVAGFWLLVASPEMETWALCSVVLGPLLMWALPPLIVSSQAADRKIDIERGLPDVLDMLNILNMGVSQGLTVPATLNRISSEIGTVHPDLARELAIVNQQAKVGTLNQALRNFAQRIDSPEVSSFTSLLMQAQTTGTSISQALTDYSDSMRSSLRERADAMANAASFKLLFPTALCLMPSVFLFLLGPAIVDMSDFIQNTSGSLAETRSAAAETLAQQPTASRP
jgi:tight adherence protein C